MTVTPRWLSHFPGTAKVTAKTDNASPSLRGLAVLSVHSQPSENDPWPRGSEVVFVLTKIVAELDRHRIHIKVPTVVAGGRSLLPAPRRTTLVLSETWHQPLALMNLDRVIVADDDLAAFAAKNQIEGESFFVAADTVEHATRRTLVLKNAFESAFITHVRRYCRWEVRQW